MSRIHQRYQSTLPFTRLLMAISLTLPGSAALLSGQTASPPSIHATRGATVEGITEYTLPNGLRVLFFPDSSKPKVTISMTYFVGSRYEGYGETGMAHLLEHLQFKGTPTHLHIPQEMTLHGAEFNATTSYDLTLYYEEMLATNTNLTWALQLEADRMLHSFIAKHDLDSEMSVVRNEYEIDENSVDNVLQQRVASTAYLWHNYGHATIGARSDIEQVPIERLQSFYHRYYQPDNAMLVVAGEFPQAATLAKVERIFGGLPRPTRTGVMKTYPTYTIEPAQDGERSVTLQRTGDQQSVLEAYHIPSGAHPDLAALDILAQILASEPSGRLYHELVESKLASGIDAEPMHQREPGLFMISANVPNGQSLDTVRTILAQSLAEIQAHSVTAEEVSRAQTALRSSWDRAFNSTDEIAIELGEYASIGDWRLFFLERDRWATVTPADVQRVAQVYFKPSNRTVGLFIPVTKADRVEVPVTPDIAQMVNNYQSHGTVAAGEVFNVSPQNIEARVDRTTLSNGVKLVMLPKRTRGGTVHVSMDFHFGDEQSWQGKLTAAALASAMLTRGSLQHTRQEIHDLRDKLKMDGSISATTDGVEITLNTTRENLLPALALVREMVRQPAFKPEELETLKQERISDIESDRSEPQNVASLAFNRHFNTLPPSDPRYNLSPDEQIAQIKSISIDSVKAFYRHFYGSSHGEIAVVGDFDTTAVRTNLDSAYADWKSGVPYVRLTDPYPTAAPWDTTIETPDKTSAFYLVAQPLAMTDTSPDYEAMRVAAFIFGGSPLDSRLAARVRQQAGLSYALQAQLDVHAVDSAGAFAGYAMYAPQNRDKIDSLFRDEFRRFVSQGITQTELDRAKAAMSQEEQSERADDEALVEILVTYADFNRTMAFDIDHDRQLQALTVAQVNAAIKKYLHPDQLSYVRAGDFAGKGGSPTAAAQDTTRDSTQAQTQDSLTLALAKTIVTAQGTIDSITKARDIPNLEVQPDSTLPTALAKLINSSPDLQAVVKRTGMTVDTYAHQLARLTCAIFLTSIADRFGQSVDQIVTTNPAFQKPSAQDLAFVRAHAQELKALGILSQDSQ